MHAVNVLLYAAICFDHWHFLSRYLMHAHLPCTASYRSLPHNIIIKLVFGHRCPYNFNLAIIMPDKYHTIVQSESILIMTGVHGT